MRLWKKIPNCWRCDFFDSAQTVTASGQNALHYDWSASGSIMYTYVNGNPISKIDPLGLAEICSKFWHPHTFLCVGGSCSGKYPAGNPYIPFYDPPGEINDDSKNKSSASCSDVPRGKCDQKSFDQCVAKRIANRGSSGDRYNPSTNNCGQWAEDVIQQCRNECTKK